MRKRVLEHFRIEKYEALNGIPRKGGCLSINGVLRVTNNFDSGKNIFVGSSGFVPRYTREVEGGACFKEGEPVDSSNCLQSSSVSYESTFEKGPGFWVVLDLEPMKRETIVGFHN